MAISKSNNKALRKRKNHFDLTRFGRRNQRVSIQEKISDLNLYLNSMGLQIRTVHIVSKNEKKDEEVELTLNGKLISGKSEKVKIELLNALKAVDASNISERAFHGLKKTLHLNAMPSLYNLTRFKKRLNQFFELQSNDYGNFVNARQKIDYVLKKIYKRDPSLVKNNTFMLKFSGDGTNITKTSVQLLNFTFTVLNEKEICKTSAGNYILGK